jgi:hypothetical protein
MATAVKGSMGEVLPGDFPPQAPSAVNDTINTALRHFTDIATKTSEGWVGKALES